MCKYTIKHIRPRAKKFKWVSIQLSTFGLVQKKFKWVSIQLNTFGLVQNCYFPHSWSLTGYVHRVTRRMPLVERELFTFPEHLSSPPVFSVVDVTWPLVSCVMFCRSLFVVLYFFFWLLCRMSFYLRILITPF